MFIIYHFINIYLLPSYPTFLSMLKVNKVYYMFCDFLQFLLFSSSKIENFSLYIIQWCTAGYSCIAVILPHHRSFFPVNFKGIPFTNNQQKCPQFRIPFLNSHNKHRVCEMMSMKRTDKSMLQEWVLSGTYLFSGRKEGSKYFTHSI